MLTLIAVLLFALLAVVIIQTVILFKVWHTTLNDIEVKIHNAGVTTWKIYTFLNPEATPLAKFRKLGKHRDKKDGKKKQCVRCGKEATTKDEFCPFCGLKYNIKGELNQQLNDLYNEKRKHEQDLKRTESFIQELKKKAKYIMKQGCI
ncbi:MAG: hypothetical protein JXK07_10110 [Spirochaetes bacterium]|nr:hypothetical protein [Spirochaetota bacterium]MBN2771248.1 hypothetical protein [Spirochaetota bacterium]